MIETDISNAWGAFDFSGLIAMEGRLTAAHQKLERDCPVWLRLPELTDEPALDELRRAANRIRSESDALVVIGSDALCSGARAVIRMLNGTLSRNTNQTSVYYAGYGFSEGALNEIAGYIENVDFSLLLLATEDYPLENAAAVRVFRWILNRRYGPEKARERIYAVTDGRRGKLHAMAVEEGWCCFSLPTGIEHRYETLTAAGLLPMAVAGVDIRALMAGARQAREQLCDGSMENPAWLYAGVRSLLHDEGRRIECLCGCEVGFPELGRWWSQLLSGSEGMNEQGLFTMYAQLPSELGSIGAPVQRSGSIAFETFLWFDGNTSELELQLDWKNTDDMNFLAGKTIGYLKEQAFENALRYRTDNGVPVVMLRCGKTDARTLGQLVYFMQYACVLRTNMIAADPYENELLRACERDMMSNLRS